VTLPRDEVDRLAAAWQRERPDLDVAPLQVLSRVTRLARHLDLGRRQSFTAHSLEGWEFDVLAALRRAGQPYSMSPGQLGVETLVTSGTMTNRIDRLESRDLVRREPDPSDRRGVRVVLTEAGRRAVDDAMKDLLTREEDLLAALTKQEQVTLSDLLRVLVQQFGD
jgi:DNA-binding MarR family transcriptional regulator